MKPVKLEMTAFGSYARLTTVDFRKLDHCLYLITGDTGAGKTTIFDAIMFALYGVASGKGDKKCRTFEMMHCDYVDKSEDTVVRLEFEHMGSIYTVERKFHFKKKRNTNEYEKTTPKAKLWEADKDVLEQTDAVTARITELLGMSADQFRKIVMLAQGEFKRFLDADSEERNQILGELFDNSAYVWFQEIFDRARKKLSQRRLEEGDAKIRRAMENFLMPEELAGEEQEVYTAGHSGLEEALEKLTEKDRKLQADLEEGSESCRKRENALREALGKAKEQNKKLDELTRKKEAFHTLQEKKPDMLLQKAQADRVERAFHKVKPKDVLFHKAQKTYHDTNTKIQKLSGELGGLGKDKTEKNKLLDACKKENEQAIEQLAKDIAEIEKTLPQYDDLERNCSEQKKESKAEEEAREKTEKTEKEKEKAGKKISELKKQIEELDGIEKTAEKLRAALENTTENLNKLTDAKGIQAQVAAIHKEEDNLKEKRAALQELCKEAENLERIFHNTYQAFIKGRAGSLAKKLEEELQEKGEAPCPVCRSVFQSSVPHCFAEFVEGTPEQGDVDKARRDFERKDKKRQDLSEKITEQETRINGSKDSVIDRLRELKPDCPDWDVLDGTSYLEETIKEYKIQKQKAQEEYNEAETRCRTLEKRKKECLKKEEELKGYEDSLNHYRIDKQEHERQRIILETTINELKKNLKYPDKETAQTRKDEMQKEKKQRTNKINDAEENCRTVEKQYESISGALQESKNSLSGFGKEKDEAERNLQEEIEKQGFQGMEEVQALLQQAGGKDSDVERWLESKGMEIQNFENELENTNKRIKELEKETANLKRADLAQLECDIEKQEAEYKNIQKELELCKRQHKNHRDTADAVRNANQILKDTESAWRRLDSLADLATGANSVGGKISFDRYVMGYVFREVLDMANQRLDIMSGGRYELIHEMGANRNNAKAGLEITVLDMTTGKCRPASSLSGGESFFVSLALALGLSDVVQNHAGGKRLDTLFIDEGFGTLDNDVLDHALAVLNQLTEGQRLVGIISHVEKLKESIPQQIQVRNSDRGSFLEIVS